MMLEVSTSNLDDPEYFCVKSWNRGRPRPGIDELRRWAFAAKSRRASERWASAVEK